MGLLSKIVNREKEKNQGSKRSFLAATNTRLQNWVMSYQRINGQLVLDAKRMIMKARQLAKNNDFIIDFEKRLELLPDIVNKMIEAMKKKLLVRLRIDHNLIK